MSAHSIFAWTAAVTILAALIGLWTVLLAARLRRRYRIAPPVMTGPLELECILRAQANTAEQMIIFLPLLWVAAIYPVIAPWLAPAIGLLWCIGRYLYVTGYRAAPMKRLPGFAITLFASLLLALLGAIGVARSLLAL